jgi:hypothetical protein
MSVASMISAQVEEDASGARERGLVTLELKSFAPGA